MPQYTEEQKAFFRALQENPNLVEDLKKAGYREPQTTADLGRGVLPGTGGLGRSDYQGGLLRPAFAVEEKTGRILETRNPVTGEVIQDSPYNGQIAASSYRGQSTGTGVRGEAMFSPWDAGNPGYSFAGPQYAKQQLDLATGQSRWFDPRTGEEITNKEGFDPRKPVYGGGVTYVGKGQDTQEGRDAFRDWVNSASNGMFNQNNLNFRDKVAEPTAASTDDTSAGTAQPPTSVTDGTSFFNDLNRAFYEGNLTDDQKQSFLANIDNPDLSPEQRNAVWDASLVERANKATELVANGTKKTFNDNLGTFLNTIYSMEQANPEAYNLWLQNNPEWGVKYNAAMATGRYFTDQNIDTKKYQNTANQLSYYQSQEAGWGKDGKKDGKAYVSGYGQQWNDVTNEGGRGDFMKLGRPGAVKGGVLDFIEDNPVEVAATIASMFIPAAAPAVAGALGVSPTVASGIMAAGLETAKGGDLQDVLTAGLTQYGMGELVNNIPAAIETIDPKLSQAFTEMTQTAEGAAEGGALISPGGLLATTGELVDGVRDYTDGVDINGVAWQPPEISDVPGDVQVQVPDYSMPQDTAGGGEPAATDTSTSASGGSTAPEPGETITPNHAVRDEEPAWTHTNPDGSVVAGNEMGEVWELEPADTVEDPNDWQAGLVLGGDWADLTGDMNNVQGDTGGEYFGFGSDAWTGTGTTGSTGGTGDGGSGSGSGGGTGDGSGGGSGSQGGGAGSAAGIAGLLAAGGKPSEYKKFTASVDADFPLLSKLNLSPSDYLKLLMADMG